MLESDCTNACAFNGLPGPKRHWFTGFTHSLTPSLTGDADDGGSEMMCNDHALYACIYNNEAGRFDRVTDERTG